MDPIKFVYLKEVKGKEEEEITFECTFNVPSMIVQDKLADLNKKLVQAYTELQSKDPESFAKLKSITNPTDEALNSEQIKKALDISDDFRNLNNEIAVEMLKVIINQRQLVTENKALIQDNYKSSFWRQQDLEVIEQTVQLFRTKIKV